MVKGSLVFSNSCQGARRHGAKGTGWRPSASAPFRCLSKPYPVHSTCSWSWSVNSSYWKPMPAGDRNGSPAVIANGYFSGCTYEGSPQDGENGSGSHRILLAPGTATGMRGFPAEERAGGTMEPCAGHMDRSPEWPIVRLS